MAEFILGGESRFEKQKFNAYWTKSAIDTKYKVNNDSVNCYRNHLLDCKSNPTIGLLAREQFITGVPMNYPAYAKRNRKLMEQLPEINNLKNNLNTKIGILYPRTKYIREYIIKTKRVLLDSVEPVKKYTRTEKLMLMFKKFFKI